MANIDEDIKNLLTWADVFLGAIIKPNTYVKTPPLASAPPANGKEAQLAQAEPIVSKRVGDAVASAQQAADRARGSAADAAAATAEVAKAPDPARAEAEAERAAAEAAAEAKAATTAADKRRVQFADDVAATAPDPAEAAAAAAADADADAVADAKSKAYNSVYEERNRKFKDLKTFFDSCDTREDKNTIHDQDERVNELYNRFKRPIRQTISDRQTTIMDIISNAKSFLAELGGETPEIRIKFYLKLIPNEEKDIEAKLRVDDPPNEELRLKGLYIEDYKDHAIYLLEEYKAQNEQRLRIKIEAEEKQKKITALVEQILLDANAFSNQSLEEASNSRNAEGHVIFNSNDLMELKELSLLSKNNFRSEIMFSVKALSNKLTNYVIDKGEITKEELLDCLFDKLSPESSNKKEKIDELVKKIIEDQTLAQDLWDLNNKFKGIDKSKNIDEFKKYISSHKTLSDKLNGLTGVDKDQDGNNHEVTKGELMIVLFKKIKSNELTNVLDKMMIQSNVLINRKPEEFYEIPAETQIPSKDNRPTKSPPKPNWTSLLTPPALTAVSVLAFSAGVGLLTAGTIGTFGALPLALGIAIGVGSIAYYSKTRKNSSEIESKPKEVESKEDIKIKELEDKVSKLFGNKSMYPRLSELSKKTFNQSKEKAYIELKPLKVEKIKKLYRENPIETLEGFFGKDGRFKPEYVTDFGSFDSRIKKAELEAILKEIDPYSYPDHLKKVDDENKNNSEKIDYSKLYSIAWEKLHRLQADKVIDSFVDSNNEVFKKADLTILNSIMLNHVEKQGGADRVIDASIKILEESKNRHDKTKTFGQNLIDFDKTIKELNEIKKSYKSKEYYPSLPLENDPFKREKEKENEESEKKQEEITDFGKSLLDNNRSRVDDLREKIEELKSPNENQLPWSENYFKKQREVTKMAENLIKGSAGFSLFRFISFSSTRDKKIDYSKKLQEYLGDDAGLVRKVGTDRNGQTAIDAKSIFDKEAEKMVTKPTTAPRPRPTTPTRRKKIPAISGSNTKDPHTKILSEHKNVKTQLLLSGLPDVAESQSLALFSRKKFAEAEEENLLSPPLDAKLVPVTPATISNPLYNPFATITPPPRSR